MECWMLAPKSPEPDPKIMAASNFEGIPLSIRYCCTEVMIFGNGIVRD